MSLPILYKIVRVSLASNPFNLIAIEHYLWKLFSSNQKRMRFMKPIRTCKTFNGNTHVLVFKKFNGNTQVLVCKKFNGNTQVLKCKMLNGLQ